MAKYGARYSRWAPWAKDFADTNTEALPKYDTPVGVGELNKINETLNFKEGSLPGDDQIVLYEKLFKDGSMDVESVYLQVKDAATMLGASCDEENGLSHGDDDKPPYGGYGFITHHVSKTKTYFQAIFYPKVKATPTAETYETRGDTINFTTDKMPFHIESPACRKYKVVKDFASEAAAKAYIDAIFAGTAAVPGLPKAGAGAPASST
ncbi:MAG: hypothetical protein ACI3VZ_08210 [Faecousia sp.]